MADAQPSRLKEAMTHLRRHESLLQWIAASMAGVVALKLLGRFGFWAALAGFAIIGGGLGYLPPPKSKVWALAGVSLLPVLAVRHAIEYDRAHPQYHSEMSWLPVGSAIGWIMCASVTAGGIWIGRHLGGVVRPEPKASSEAGLVVAPSRPRGNLLSLIVLASIGAGTMLAVDAYVRAVWKDVYMHVPYPGHEMALHDGNIKPSWNAHPAAEWLTIQVLFAVSFFVGLSPWTAGRRAGIALWAGVAAAMLSAMLTDTAKFFQSNLWPLTIVITPIMAAVPVAAGWGLALVARAGYRLLLRR